MSSRREGEESTVHLISESSSGVSAPVDDSQGKPESDSQMTDIKTVEDSTPGELKEESRASPGSEQHQTGASLGPEAQAEHSRNQVLDEHADHDQHQRGEPREEPGAYRDDQQTQPEPQVAEEAGPGAPAQESKPAPDRMSEMSDIRTLKERALLDGQEIPPKTEATTERRLDDEDIQSTLEYEFAREQADRPGPGFPPPQLPEGQRQTAVPPEYRDDFTPSLPPHYETRMDHEGTPRPQDAPGAVSKQTRDSGTFYAAAKPSAEEVQQANLRRISEDQPALGVEQAEERRVVVVTDDDFGNILGASVDRIETPEGEETEMMDKDATESFHTHGAEDDKPADNFSTTRDDDLRQISGATGSFTRDLGTQSKTRDADEKQQQRLQQPGPYGLQYEAPQDSVEMLGLSAQDGVQQPSPGEPSHVRTSSPKAPQPHSARNVFTPSAEEAGAGTSVGDEAEARPSSSDPTISLTEIEEGVELKTAYLLQPDGTPVPPEGQPSQSRSCKLKSFLKQMKVYEFFSFLKLPMKNNVISVLYPGYSILCAFHHRIFGWLIFKMKQFLTGVL